MAAEPTSLELPASPPRRLAVPGLFWSGVVMLAAPLAILVGVHLVGAGSVQHLAPPCIFHLLTGLNCPGCGGTRCVLALSQGQVGEALHHNPLVFCLLPLYLVWAGHNLYRGTTGRILPRLRLGGTALIGLLIVVILFGILRNLPWYPFTQLGP